jgi:arabinofuranosyltransferase
MAEGAATKVARGLLLGLPVLILAIGAWHSHWMSDDGFINLRVVSQIQAGHGPVFNAGERVEASTSPLWILLLTLGDIVTPVRLEWIAVIGGIGLTLGGLALAIFGAVRLQRGEAERALWIPAGALVVAVFPPFWRFASSGLETGLSFAWIGASLALLGTWASPRPDDTDDASASPEQVTEGDDDSGARDDRQQLSLWAAVVLGLGPLIRPELSLVSLGFLGIVLAAQWRASTWRSRLALVGAAFALPIAYQVFRMGYYGSLVPNTAFAKEAARSYWSAGATYLRKTVVDHYALWVPLLVLLAGAYAPLVLSLRRRGQHRGVLVVAAFGISALVEALYVVRVGGDFMDNRFLMPPLFVLLAPIAVVPATRRFVVALAVVPWAVLALGVLRGPEDGVPYAFAVGTRNPVTTEDFGMAPGGTERAFFTGHGVYYLQRRLPGRPSGHDPALATYGVGVPSYSLGPDTYVLDLFGLGDPITSHLQLQRRATVAHEKPLPRPWIPARLLRPGSKVTEADLQLPPLFYARSLDDPRGEPFARRVHDARAALRCSRLRDFVATYRAPLDAGRFFENLGASFSNYGFRIPPEPRAARAELCG